MDIGLIAFGFFLMLALLFLGLPVAVTMVLMGVGGGLLAYGMPLVRSMGDVVWGTLNDSIMTAIPLFMLLGELLLRGGIADKMYDTFAMWLGRLPGGLLHSNIGCCALFAATSGSSVATAATIGTVALPSLEARNYPAPQVLGSLAAGGTLGILIPPSVNLLVYGSLANTSVGELFVAGFVPGLLLTLVFSLYIAAANWRQREKFSAEAAVPLGERVRLLRFLLPPLTIFGIVMGTIYGGIATPTESAALGVLAALFFVWHSGRLSWRLLVDCFIQTARTTGMVTMVIVSALMLNVTLSILGIAQALTTWVQTLGLGATALLVVLVVFYVILGMFMDVMSMLVLTVPIAVPMVAHVGVDPVWFGIFIVIMCEIGLITPPVGMNLYVIQGLRKGRGPFSDVVRGSVPYVALMIGFTLVLIWLPEIALWLPQSMFGH